MEKDKSLEELRAAIEEDQQEADEDSTDDNSEQENDPEHEEASDDETTSTEEEKEASESDSTETTSEPDWVVPGKFRTNEDVLQGYNNLEELVGRQSSEVQRLRSMIQEPKRQGESEQERIDRLQRFADKVKADPIEAIREIARNEVNQVKSDVKKTEFERAYHEKKKDKEFSELEPVMTQIATNYGDMIQANGLQNDPRLLDILYMAAKGIKAAEAAKEAESKGVKKGQDLHRRKQKAKLEGSTGKKKTRKIDVTKLTSKEMKAKMESGDLDITE